MKKNNFKVKENITFEDKANAIEYISNSLFDFDEEGEIIDYSPYYVEPAQVCAILNYFVDGIEFENGESIYDVAVADKDKKLVKGVMIESYLLEGRQDISDHMTPGCSITDPCLGWEDTERLIYDIAEKC